MVRTPEGLSLRQKQLLVTYHVQNPKIAQNALCVWAEKEFKLRKRPNQAMISRILKRKQEFEEVAPQDKSLKRARVQF